MAPVRHANFKDAVEVKNISDYQMIEAAVSRRPLSISTAKVFVALP
jgi:hypothetical protein